MTDGAALVHVGFDIGLGFHLELTGMSYEFCPSTRNLSLRSGNHSPSSSRTIFLNTASCAVHQPGNGTSRLSSAVAALNAARNKASITKPLTNMRVMATRKKLNSVLEVLLVIIPMRGLTVTRITDMDSFFSTISFSPFYTVPRMNPSPSGCW